MRRLRIAVDMDEVIADTLPHHLKVFREVTGVNLTAEAIREHGMAGLLTPEQRLQWGEVIFQPGFYADLDVMPGAQRALEALSADHDIYVASAAMYVPPSFMDKYRWLERHFAFIPSTRWIFCGDKNMLDVDYLIDDRSMHFADFRGTGILFTAPHNALEEAPLRAGDWYEVMDIVARQQEAELAR